MHGKTKPLTLCTHADLQMSTPLIHCRTADDVVIQVAPLLYHYQSLHQVIDVMLVLTDNVGDGNFRPSFL